MKVNQPIAGCLLLAARVIILVFVCDSPLAKLGLCQIKKTLMVLLITVVFLFQLFIMDSFMKDLHSLLLWPTFPGCRNTRCSLIIIISSKVFPKRNEDMENPYGAGTLLPLY